MLIILLGTDYANADAGRIETISGNVELWLQEQANITLHAFAGGGIDAGDVGVAVEKADNAATVTFGNGDARLDVSTAHGTLVVRTLPAPL